MLLFAGRIHSTCTDVS